MILRGKYPDPGDTTGGAKSINRNVNACTCVSMYLLVIKICSKSESGRRKKKEFLLDQTGDPSVCLTEIRCEHQTDSGETCVEKENAKIFEH